MANNDSKACARLRTWAEVERRPHRRRGQRVGRGEGARHPKVPQLQDAPLSDEYVLGLA
jgi:hypothetical protein